MFASIAESSEVYRKMLGEVADFVREKGAVIENPAYWNSADQQILRDKLMRLEGSEDTLGLPPRVIEEGRRVAGIPARREAATTV